MQTSAHPATFGVPNFGVFGIGPIGSADEVIGADDKDFQVADTVTLTHGKLTYMAGVQCIGRVLATARVLAETDERGEA